MTLASNTQPASARLRIYYVNPLLLAGPDSWNEVFEHARALGFGVVMSAPIFKMRDGAGLFSSMDLEMINEALGLGENLREAFSSLVTLARAHGLDFMLDIAPGFSGSRGAMLDPRRSPVDPSFGSLPLSSTQIDEWEDRLRRFAELGIGGYRMLGLNLLPDKAWRRLIVAAKSENPASKCFAYTPGTDFALRRSLQDCGFDGAFSSLCWWDMREGWLLEELRLQQPFGLQIAFPEMPFGRRTAHGDDSRDVRERRSLRALRLANEVGGGLLIPMGFEFGATLPLDPTFGTGEGLLRLRQDGDFDITSEIKEVNLGGHEETRQLASIRQEKFGQITVLAQADQLDLRNATDGRLLIVNRDLRNVAVLPRDAIRRFASPFLPANQTANSSHLHPGELRIVEMATQPEIKAQQGDIAIVEATLSARIAIEGVSPTVDNGRFPIKRIVGDTILVEADIFADGHDPLCASLLYRPRDETGWNEAGMEFVGNDRWQAAFSATRVGRHEFCVEAWKGPFMVFRQELLKKHEARLDLHLEIIEGENLIRTAVADPAVTMTVPERDALLRVLTDLEASDSSGRIASLLSPHTNALMARADRRPFRVRSQIFAVEVERPQAAFASWYQIFPRSQSGDPHRHGTFEDVAARLASIRDMGFDVLYFPPIHPIGHTNRKGRNNSLVAAPDDPGSPYAIGSKDGGHDAIHPLLGAFDDFERLVAEAKRFGLEIALDLAIQASPDHPWLKDHPGWFNWRPDGTIRYAENPPKKYEDIVNVDFYEQDAMPDLWIELRDIVEMWIGEGVRIFRVDNPHTKPFPFWEWMIADIRARHPDAIFLSEAFTRPKVMYRLAKVGFSQSYTYFTWRNSRAELEQYMHELTQSHVREFFRPHFFVNTHDINPDFLQNAPRPAYLIRAVLAATLSGLWGVYNGFELCEGRPDAKRKEYADSEKYEIRAWDYDRPGNIKAEISMLNRIRRDNPALHSHLGLTLLPSSNSNVMFYEKASPGRHNVLLIAVNLNPHMIEESQVEFPLWHFGLDDGATVSIDDLVTGQRFDRGGKRQTIRLDPTQLPYAIWRITVKEA